MTSRQERAITLALNVLHVSFFECPKRYFEYFINNDEWALLMTAGEVNAVDTPPHAVALAVLQAAVARRGFFEAMTDFQPPEHFCSFLRDKINAGERKMTLEPCRRGQQDCPYATFEHIRESARRSRVCDADDANQSR